MRKTLQLTKLQKLAMFRSCIDSLIKNLELYPQVCFFSKFIVLLKVNIYRYIYIMRPTIRDNCLLFVFGMNFFFNNLFLLNQYLQDEADIFYAIYRIGQIHGKFVTSIIHEVSQEVSGCSTFLSRSFPLMLLSEDGKSINNYVYNGLLFNKGI